ncbi:hypothetical protein GCM10010282_50940 [Streptomyces roseolus]|nr:hypothetical protein GCM10010282_50940 [Streptomyces roseolus]
MRYRVVFKSHRNGSREYSAETGDRGTAHFVKAALDNANWHVLRIEECPKGDARITEERERYD